MKSRRHSRILELIMDHDIDTQGELLRLLNDGGFKVTQATVSRDVKELRLVKVQLSSGSYRYSTNSHKDSIDMSYKFHAIFSESVVKIDWAENIVVIRCYVGMANAACAALDSIAWDGMVGTLAGDDTIFCVMRDKNNAEALNTQLQTLLK